MTTSRLETFRALVAKNPRNAVAHFGLANELLKEAHWDEAVEHLRSYLSLHDDEGNAYGRLAEALMHLGRVAEAREALGQGISAAQRCGHPGMAEEFQERLEELGNG
jgi:predicted Zn-dependent protease